MPKVWSALLLVGVVALTMAGCVLAPVPVPGPVVVAPGAHGGYYRHHHRPHYRHRHW
jgi:hypothetical protein